MSSLRVPFLQQSPRSLWVCRRWRARQRSNQLLVSRRGLLHFGWIAFAHSLCSNSNMECIQSGCILPEFPLRYEMLGINAAYFQSLGYLLKLFICFRGRASSKCPCSVIRSTYPQRSCPLGSVGSPEHIPRILNLVFRDWVGRFAWAGIA